MALGDAEFYLVRFCRWNDWDDAHKQVGTTDTKAPTPIGTAKLLVTPSNAIQPIYAPLQVSGALTWR
jgi:hypothetical protein